MESDSDIKYVSSNPLPIEKKNSHLYNTTGHKDSSFKSGSFDNFWSRRNSSLLLKNFIQHDDNKTRIKGTRITPRAHEDNHEINKKDEPTPRDDLKVSIKEELNVSRSANERKFSRRKNSATTSPRVLFNLLHKDNEKEDSVDNDNYEKLRKTFPHADVPREIFGCKFKRKHCTGKLYITPNIFYFIGKKVSKKWMKDSLIDAEKIDKIKDEEMAHEIKLLKYKFADDRIITDKLVFKTQDIRDNCLKNIYRRFFDPMSGRNTALHTAILNAEQWRIKLLVEYDPGKLKESNRLNETPLLLACINGNKDIVDLLLSYYKKFNIDINISTNSGRDHLLHRVCQERIKDDIILSIINFPQIDINSSNVDGTTPLHYLVKHTSSNQCNILIDEMIKAGAHVNAETSKKETPIHRAMQNTGVVGARVVQSLLSHHPNINTVTENTKETPLHYAVRLGRRDILSMIIDAGSDILVRNKEGNDALQVAIREYESLDPLKDQKMIENYDYIIKILKNVKRMREILNDSGLQDLLENFIKKDLYNDLNTFACLDDDTLKREFSVGLGPLFRLHKHLTTLKEELAKEEKIASLIEISPKPPKEEIQNLRMDLKRSEEGTGTWEIDARSIDLLFELGKGTSGAVFKAVWQHQDVAVKILTSEDSDYVIDEFKKEFLILIRLSSPYVVKFYGATIFPYISLVMEYCENGNLHDYLKSHAEGFSWEFMMEFASNMAEGIKDLHSHNPPIIHRDLKSLNILVTKDLKCKVCDFGLSRLFDVSNKTLTKLCGTPAYVAPEIFQSEKGKATSKSDVYSMGIILWELLYTVLMKKYESPFTEYGLVGQGIFVEAALNGTRPTLPENCPPIFVQLYDLCVSQDPETRPTSQVVLHTLKNAKKIYSENPYSFSNTVIIAKKKYISKSDVIPTSTTISRSLPNDDILSIRSSPTIICDLTQSSNFPGWNKVETVSAPILITPPKADHHPHPNRNKENKKKILLFTSWENDTTKEDELGSRFPGWSPM